ncbi:Apoptotic chromatin condensation inducer in the nucleus [Larimichthys crocea]|uniref:Uncharacterized protein n=1 Tax=Larimichthys crocea TaxID=215358 RepID=A0ACD3Q676_LARCR|nr:Apoptotic chromatin condensation inducer in the nucleus [Larimichthys crocea]
MADEDITLDGKPLQSLRVADLKAALEQRNLPKSGQKNTLVKRLKGALMLENLQKSSSSHSGLQPNSQKAQQCRRRMKTIQRTMTAPPTSPTSRSAGVSAGGHVHEDNDEDDSGDDESEDDEDWGPGPGGARRGNRAPPQPQQMPPSVPSTVARSKRKLQLPQHIPPPQAHHTPMQLRHPTPPPSPPPDLFPLPDTPKQSPPDTDDQEGEGPEAARGSRVNLHCTNWREKRLHDNREVEEAKRLKEEKEREQRKTQEQEKEKKRLEGEKEKERKRLEEEEKLRQKEEKEKERKRQEAEKERKRQEEEKEKERKRRDEEKQREEKLQKEKTQKTTIKDKVAVQDSGSSSDSDSKSDSSSNSSQSSSSSSGDKARPASHLKKADRGQEAEDEKKTNLSKEVEKRYLSKREVSEPSAATVTEVEPDSESSMAQQPPSGAEPDTNEGRLEESTTPKAFAARKISLTSSKTSPGATDGGAGDADTGTAAGRKRRWGSSTSVTAKKPSISITTDSLKSLIPDIKVNQEAVVELHPEELQLSGDEESLDASRGDQDKGLKIRRTVTQVRRGRMRLMKSFVMSSQVTTRRTDRRTRKRKRWRNRRRKNNAGLPETKRKNSVSEEALETQTSVKLDGEAKKVTPSESLVRRSISQQKSGVSVTIDDPVRTTSQPSPSQAKISNIIHVTNLVRPFTLGQLKELLNRTGVVMEEGFWIDKIKSHCFVTYTTTKEAFASRAALHGVKWPQSNPKVLSVEFCEQAELDFHKGVLKPEKEEEPAAPLIAPQPRLPPLMPERENRDRERDRDRDRERERDRERDRGMGGVRDLWAEREREMERRERARGEREWDRDKVREFARPGEDGQRISIQR